MITKEIKAELFSQFKEAAKLAKYIPHNLKEVKKVRFNAGEENNDKTHAAMWTAIHYVECKITRQKLRLRDLSSTRIARTMGLTYSAVNHARKEFLNVESML